MQHRRTLGTAPRVPRLLVASQLEERQAQRVEFLGQSSLAKWRDRRGLNAERDGDDAGGGEPDRAIRRILDVARQNERGAASRRQDHGDGERTAAAIPTDTEDAHHGVGRDFNRDDNRSPQDAGKGGGVHRRTVSVLLFAFAAILAASCSSEPVVKRDGSLRVPDAEGVVEKVSPTRITLDGGRSYPVSSALVSFPTSRPRRDTKLASTVGSYVQLGVKHAQARWLAVVGVVTTDASGHKTAMYHGTLARVAGTKLVFKDGTVLQLAKGLMTPKNPTGLVYVVIDAQLHVVQGASFQ